MGTYCDTDSTDPTEYFQVFLNALGKWVIYSTLKV